VIADLEMALGWRIPETEFVFHRGSRAGRDLGVAMVTEEKGRFKPITFLVKVRPDGEVEAVHIMVYRESRGDGVKRQRFLKQFRGKDADSHLRMNRDITNLSGATLSSRAVTAGVKRVLHLVRTRYGTDEAGE
jgi:Na+-translocating ferredoxin:NAD+ oxidoreductase RnfG subunit